MLCIHVIACHTLWLRRCGSAQVLRMCVKELAHSSSLCETVCNCIHVHVYVHTESGRALEGATESCECGVRTEARYHFT